METSIYLQYPEISNLIHLLPSDRKKKIDLELAGKFEKFIQAFPQIVYQRIGTKKRPRGIHASISLDEAKLIAESDIVNSIFVKDIHQARKKRVRSSQCFFCVKMTVAIQIEGLEKGLQTYEQRLVLIRAKSEQDAYSKLEQQREVYGKPYLNSDGRQVRWMIESLDDCYAIDVSKLSDFIHPSGVEVFSKLKTRKLTRERIWDGR
jgi:hypothetical protein